jgi:hypothetical protein
MLPHKALMLCFRAFLISAYKWLWRLVMYKC